MLKQAALLSALMTVGYASFIERVLDNDARNLMSEESLFRDLNAGLRNLQTTTRVTKLSTDTDGPQITNLTQWVTQAKANSVIGALTFN